MSFLRSLASPAIRFLASRSLLAAAAVLALTLAAAAVAASDDASSAPDLASSREYQRATQEFSEESRRREEARRERRATPEAQAEREATRTRYRDQTAGQALATARREHKDVVEAAAHRGLRLRDGERVVRFHGDQTAQVERDGAPGGALVESTLPMRTTRPDGERVLVDLRLEDRGGWLEPADPLVDVRLPKRVDQPALLAGSGLAFQPRVDNDAPAQVVADKAFYAEIAEDTDYLLHPRPTGVESFFQLRSHESPEELVVDVELPPGTRLNRRAARPGAIEVLRGDEVLGMFMPPVAWDADREPVEVTWELTGDAIRLDVAHRGHDVKYPVLVDPTWTEDQRYWHRADLNNGIKDRNGWSYQENDSNGSFTNDQPSGANQGLWLWAGPGAIQGQFGQWVFQAPAGAWIFRFETYTSHTTADRGTSVFIGIYGGDGARAEPPTWGWTPVSLYDWDSKPYGSGQVNVWEANWNWSDLYLTECAGDNPCWPYHANGSPAAFKRNAAVFKLAKDFGAMYHSAWLGGALISMQDDDPPSISATTNAPAGWVDDATVTATGSASDNGFGVKDFELWRTAPGTATGLGGLPTTSQCSNTQRPVHCPSSDSETFVHSTTAAPDDVNTYGIRARDFVGNLSGFATWQVKLDRTPPAAPTAGGSLYTATRTGDGVASANSETLDVNGADTGSGVKNVSFRLKDAATGAVPRSGTGSHVSCHVANGCPKTWSRTFTIDTTVLRGEHIVEATTRDQLSDGPHPTRHVRTVPDLFRVSFDRDAPSIGAVTHAPAGVADRWHKATDQITTTVPASDDVAGIWKWELQFPGGSPASTARNCATWDRRCAKSDSEAITYTTDAARFPSEGLAEVGATVRDGTADLGGRLSTVVKWPIKIDRTGPSVTLSGGLTSPNPTGRNLHVEATDGSPQSRRSGARRIEVFIDRDGDGTQESEAVVDRACVPDSCALELDYVLPVDYPEGRHVGKVVATDEAGNATEKPLEFYVVNLLPADRARLGLEDFFDYDILEAGGDSRVHVNAETGNAVWHSVPIVNPGRGLSTFVNLTYNSQDRGGLLGSTLGRVPIVDIGGADLSQDLPGLSYGEAGAGFSVSVSGPTRVNEPLGGVELAEKKEVLNDRTAFLSYLRADLGLEVPDETPLGDAITLTDADGTVHTFQRGEGNQWIHPPGVAMRLRRYNDTAASRVSIVPDKWAMTRPDGVTHFFDNLGYLTSTRDRNGNTLRYDYKHVNVLDGAECPAGTTLGDLVTQGTAQVFCVRRLDRVVDPAGVDAGAAAPSSSVLSIAYRAGGLLTTSQLPFDSPLPFPGLIGGRAGRIDTITDHAGRTYKFDYDGDGFLTQLTEAANAPVSESTPRVTRFEYETKSPGLPGPLDDGLGQDRQLTNIVEVRGGADYATTPIRYQARDDSPPVPGVSRRPRPVETLTSRTGFDRDFTYTANADGTRDMRVVATLKKAGADAAVTAATTHKVDSRGRPISTIDALGQQTKLEWTTDHRVEKLIEAAGSAAEAITDFTYNDNGLLDTRKTYPKPGETRTLDLDYRDSAGIYRSSVVDDDAARFVSDLEDVNNPRANTGWHFEYLDDRGNPTRRTDANNKSADTLYNAKGQVISETDEVGNVTTFGDFHPTGQPQSMIDPKGTKYDFPRKLRWIYHYDAVGNLTEVTDPRGDEEGLALSAPHSKYTTKLSYDSFDRLVSERIPKDSTAATPTFITRSRTYDRNGNVLTAEDGLTKRTTMTYNKMDQPATVAAPAAGTTTYDYDGAERLVKVLHPVTSAAPASSTQYELDLVGQPQAEIRRGQNLADLVTSFDYDERGNLVGLEDPKRNRGRTLAAAIAAAAGPSRRLTYEYNDVDERTVKTERPGAGEATGVEAITTAYEYDANGNRAEVVHPRSFDSDDPTGSPLTTTYEYDHRDELVKVTDPEGKARRYTRREDGKVIAETSARGATSATEPVVDGETGLTYVVPKYFTTRYEYDPLGQIIRRTVPYHAGQYELPDATLKAWDYEYGRDRVGNAQTIIDPRGNPITNTFFDTGDLRSTTRPSAYDLDWGEAEEGGGHASPDPGDRFDLAGDDIDARVADGGPRLVERPGVSSNAERSDEAPELPSSDGEGNFGAVERERLHDMLPRAGATTFAYDDEMRLTSISGRTLAYDDAGRVTRKSWPFKAGQPIEHSYTYDTHGNLTRFEDGENQTTTFAYDGFDRRTREDAPGAGATDTSPRAVETTTLAYDENGNLRSRATPRDGFSFEYGYDTFDRLTSETNPAGETWRYAYDVAGNRVMERSPEGAGRTGADQDRFETSMTYDLADRVKTMTQAPGSLDLRTSYEYDADGNRTRVEAPGAKASPGAAVEPRVTEMTYDGRDMPWKEVEGTGTNRRTILRTFDANGNLRRTLNPDGVGDSQASDDGTLTAGNVKNATRHARLHVYDADDLLTFAYLPWGDQVPDVSPDGTSRVDDKRYVQRFDRDARGRVTSIFAPYEVGASAAPQTTYSYFDTDWISGMSDEEMRKPTPPNPPISEHLVTYDYDKRGNQTRWKTRNANTSRGRVVTREFWPNGLLRSRTGKKVNDDDTPDETTTRTYRHGYNENRSLVWMKDERKAGDPGDDRVTTFTRDGAEREKLVNETWSEGKDTSLTYDANGNVLTRKTDGRLSGTSYVDSDAGRNDAKTTTFAYDSVDRETSMVVRQGDDAARTVAKTYHPSGAPASITRDLANDIVEERYFNVFGDPTAMRRKRADASDWNLKDQAYDYDDNGNRTRDERGTHEFNARDQLVKWTRGSKQPRPGTTVTYEVTGSGAVAKKLDTAEEAVRRLTTSTFDGTRLAKTETDESESTYSYDDLGSIVRIRTASKVAGTVPAPTPELPSLPAQCTPLATAENEVRYCYDEFERMLVAKGSGVGKDAGVYEYDGFDRRDRMTVKRPTGDETRDLSYVGSSRLLSRERDAAGQTKYYDYDSDGARLGQAKAPTSTPDPATFRSYGHDANGSVEELQSPDGSVAGNDRYVYDPYGALDTRGGVVTQDPEDALSTDAKDNPFRFQGFYYDSGVKDYDMHARHYRPDVGRFTTQDRFESAGGDLNLQADPLTQNRYVFGGANPVNNVEFDGHCFVTGSPLDPFGGRPLDTRPCTRRQTQTARRSHGTRRASSGREPLAQWSRRRARAARPARVLRPRVLGSVSGSVNAGPRKDRNAIDYLANDVGGDLCGAASPSCGWLGDPGSATYQSGQARWASVPGQALLTLLPVPVGAKAKAAEELGHRTGLVGLVRRLVGGGDTKGRGSQTVRHYTTAERAVQIQKSGEIRVGADGKAYFTPGRYENASDAQGLLSLRNAPDGYFELPFSRLKNPSPFSRVAPLWGQRGGGLECSVTCATSIRGIPFRKIPR